jgi:hypothetical protein
MKAETNMTVYGVTEVEYHKNGRADCVIFNTKEEAEEYIKTHGLRHDDAPWTWRTLYIKGNIPNPTKSEVKNDQ